MPNEFGGQLEKYIMDQHWEMVSSKPYPMFKGVWEKVQVLPTTHTYNFEERLNEHLEIPLVGGGYIKLEKTTGEEIQISVDIRFPTARGEMRQDGFIINDVLKSDPYPFWIFYDSKEQDERMKFLARMKPEKDIDWDKIKPHTAEYEIAQALCKYKERDIGPRKFS